MNPFSDELFPDSMTEDGLVESLFVSEMTNIYNVLKENHHIIWGSRGAGKSMLLRYIWARNPRSYSELLAKRGTNDHLAIYLKISRAMGSKDFELLCDDNESEAMALCEHMLNMFVTQAIIKTLKKVRAVPDEVCQRIVRRIVASILDYRIIETVNAVNLNEPDLKNKAPLEWLYTITKRETGNIAEYLRRRKTNGIDYVGSYTGYDDYLLEVFHILQQELGNGRLKFFLLVDDAGYLHPTQQRIINGWIAHRDHDLLSVKISATKSDYICFSTIDGFALDPTHDFSETELDVVYYGREEYVNRLKKIFYRRLETFKLPKVDPEAFFPEEATQATLVKECEKEIEAEYNTIKYEKAIDLPTYKGRYLMPRVFQKLSEQKKEYSYSGFYNLVNLSSGIVRTFISMCSDMWSKTEEMNEANYVDQQNNLETVSISRILPSVQNLVARESASRFLQRLPRIYTESLSAGTNPYIPKGSYGPDIVDKIETLLRSLGRYYRNRLLDKRLSEQLMISFAVKKPQDLSKETKAILRLATMHSYLQLTTNSRKDSGIREDCYILSRCLAPSFNLYAGALRGRVLFSAEDLELAIHDTEKFIDRKAPKPRKKSKVQEGQLPLPELQDSAVDEDDIVLFDEE